MNIFKKLFGKQTKESLQVACLEIENKPDDSLGNLILKFQNSIQKSIELKELKNIKFAMWLPCDQDRLFASSPITGKWTIVYSLTKHYWSFIAADILKTMKLVKEETVRLALPDNFQTFAFLTTDDEPIILSLSKEKGIRLHFAETTSLKYRVLFMDSFVSYCNAWKDLIELNKDKKDDDIGFENWWSSVLKSSITLEEKGPLTGVGNIVK